VSELVNHLWQSTLFAAAAAAGCWMLRKNRARVRYWIWLAASLKFLLPGALLLSLGARWEKPEPMTVHAPVISAMRVEQIVRSFAPVTVAIAAPSSVRHAWGSPALGAIWFGGVLLIARRWWRRWAALRKLSQGATPLALDLPVPVLVSSSAIEPGVFGLFRPVLLLPEGLLGRLDRQQFESILAHELCHVRSRDNLTGAFHMAVTALFWFHPAVWWIGRRLIDERERACDEAVLLQGSRPEVYAQGIVSVCRFYAASPLPCASGVTGADLKKRIREIMTHRGSTRLTLARKLMLAGAGIAVAFLPIVIGILRAQTLPPAPEYSYDVVSIHRSDPKDMTSRLGPGPQGGLTSQNVTVMQLMTFAYDARPNQFVNFPGWIQSERFDVSFTPDKPEPGVVPGPGSFPRLQTVFNRHRQRMQAVLRDRFGLVLRAETRELPMYALVVAKGGHKLSAPAEPGKGPNFSMTRGQMTAVAAYMKMLSDSLSSLLGRYVANETGLDGPYDFTLKWTPDSAQPSGKMAIPDEPVPADSDAATSIFTALSEQLGLRLDAKKGPVPVFVVEKVERPGEN
jgi:bla regulator protein blaR1